MRDSTVTIISFQSKHQENTTKGSMEHSIRSSFCLWKVCHTLAKILCVCTVFLLLTEGASEVITAVFTNRMQPSVFSGHHKQHEIQSQEETVHSKPKVRHMNTQDIMYVSWPWSRVFDYIRSGLISRRSSEERRNWVLRKWNGTGTLLYPSHIIRHTAVTQRCLWI